MSLYLGIDGGGTKTKFLLGNEREILAETTTGGSNITRSGEPAVREALLVGMEQVCASAGVSPAEIVRTVAGITGSANPRPRALLEQFLRERLTGEIVIVGDMVIAHHAALDGAPGVLVNAGTGSIAYARNQQGDTARAGGWGFAISDEGSGHWVGRVAIAAAMRCYDSRREEAYLHHLMAALGVEDPVDLAKLANSVANPDLAQVFPAVVNIAQKGDETARKILVSAGAELSYLAETLIQRLFPTVEAVAIAGTGGIFRNSVTVFECFSAELHNVHPDVSITLPEADPALGALMLARQPL
ncbi:ATPase, BadF/BadG/BcrA/BcrD type [Candidatus Koribacter versatilis Ellin345]|uniref:ATPase, BadF/BadG/BcrA/BcrD type n=1 Tax=Koribacter versatilis (strain Ellin345) TaxID=204669 RepID=Q1IL96_KORVE|nr:BadF/BadG/BcrA/BcrD ATPase family protein [Candidatus Koribacter versatilis]ABF42354.1 ATPase, BadF/BadG/BcrA/BcrD type [Candidatus Koribacter versatilis Ellin345]